jgi:hypothetical protein
VLRVPCYSSSPRLFLAFAIAVSGRLGFDFFLRLQLRPAERAKKQRMVDERRPRFLLIDEPDAQVNDFVRSDRDQWLKFAGLKSFFQLFAASSERRPSFRHELSTPGGVVGLIFPIEAAKPY